MHEVSNIFTKEKTISSLEVAEMMEIEHWKLLRKLEGDQKSVGIHGTVIWATRKLNRRFWTVEK